MSFDVRFYTYSKRELSTVHPTTAGRAISCLANEPLDLLAPSILLEWTGQQAANPTAYNYAQIPSLGRWYWITGWSNVEGLWRAELRVDALASWETQIGAQSIYVYRSSAAYNLRVTDSTYPQLARPSRLVQNLPRIWGANLGSIVAGIISTAGTTYYAFSQGSWQAFLQHLFSQDYYDRVLGEFGAVEYPEAKVAINPIQFISSAIFVPLLPGSSVYQIPYTGTVDHIKVGSVTVPAQSAISGFTAYEIAWGITTPWTYTITSQSGPLFQHPQAADRGFWLNYSPTSELELFWPPCGLIPLEPSIIAACDKLEIRTYMDYRAGRGMLDVAAVFTSTPTADRHLYRGEFSIGTPIQLTNILTPGSAPSDRALASTVSNLFGNSDAAHGVYGAVSSLPIIGSALGNGVQSAVHGAVPRLTASGSFGSVASMDGQPAIFATYWRLADEDLPGRGRPLCEIRQISSIPGFITGEPDEISLPCTATELETIKAAIRGGFWYGV